MGAASRPTFSLYRVFILGFYTVLGWSALGGKNRNTSTTLLGLNALFYSLSWYLGGGVDDLLIVSSHSSFVGNVSNLFVRWLR
jgi:hypothetical protein